MKELRSSPLQNDRSLSIPTKCSNTSRFALLPSPFSLLPSPFSLLSSLFSLLPSPFSLLPSPFSLLLSPFSLLPSAFSLLPSPFSLLPSPFFLLLSFPALPFSIILTFCSRYLDDHDYDYEMAGRARKEDARWEKNIISQAEVKNSDPERP